MTHEDDKTLAEALAAAREAGRACALATIVGRRPAPRVISDWSIPRCSVYTSRGVHPCSLQTDAAIPTISPIAPVVFMTRTAPSASWVTLMSRPAMNRLSMLRLYRQRYGAQ